jgi:hypothetical protein
MIDVPKTRVALERIAQMLRAQSYVGPLDNEAVGMCEALSAALSRAHPGRMTEPRPGVIEILPADAEYGQRVLIVPIEEEK